MMDFVAIDFETANAGRASACALGLVEVKGGRIVSEQAWLINPEQRFDRRNIAIHGITPDMVAGQPTFGELWPTVEPLIREKHIVAHNASFDMSVLRYGLDQCALPYPTFQYWCTYLLAKKLLTDLESYRLNILAEHFGLPLRHHDALEDARAAAVLLMKLTERAGHSGLPGLAKALGCKIGTLHAGGYTPFSIPARKPSGNGKKAKPAEQTAAAPAVSAPALHPAEQGRLLVRGQRTDVGSALAYGRMLIEVAWEPGAMAQAELTAFLLDEEGMCGSGEDYFNLGNPEGSGGAISLFQLSPYRAGLLISPDRLPARTDKVAMALFVHDNGSHRKDAAVHPVLTLVNPHSGEAVARFPVEPDGEAEGGSALLIGELYRRGGTWKFNPLGHSLSGGAEALCAKLGLPAPGNEETAAARENPR